MPKHTQGTLFFSLLRDVVFDIAQNNGKLVSHDHGFNMMFIIEKHMRTTQYALIDPSSLEHHEHITIQRPTHV